MLHENHPRVKKARMNMLRKGKKGKGAAPGASAERQLMGQHDTAQGKGKPGPNPRKVARHKAFLGY